MDNYYTNMVCKEFNDDEMSFVAYASKEVLDRDGEIVKADAWDIEEYLKNPVIMLFHDYNKLPVGKALWVRKANDGLRFKPKFADTETGREVYQLYKEGILNAFSAGFRVLDWEEGKAEGVKRVYTKVKLHEISCVPVPSCPDALVERVNNGEIKTKELSKALNEIIAINKPEPEETENEIRVRLKNPADFEKDSFRRIAVKKDKPRVFGIVGKLKGKDTTTLQSYRFPKDDGWTKEKATGWADEHPVKSYTASHMKTLSLGGLPSIYDIIDKIRFTLGATPEGVKNVYIADIFPNTSMSGSCVVEFDSTINDTRSKYWYYDYSYSKETETVVLTNPIAVQEVYTMKTVGNFERKNIVEKAGRELSAKNVTMLKDVSGKMSGAAEMINSMLKDKSASEDIVIKENTVETIENEEQTDEPEKVKNYDTMNIEGIEDMKEAVKEAIKEAALSINAIKLDKREASAIVNMEIKRALGVLD